MGINKYSSVANYWEVDRYIGNDGIKNVRTQESFKIFYKTFILQTMIMMAKVTKVGLYVFYLATFIIMYHQNLPLFLSKSSVERIAILDIVEIAFSRPAT